MYLCLRKKKENVYSFDLDLIQSSSIQQLFNINTRFVSYVFGEKKGNIHSFKFSFHASSYKFKFLIAN